MVFEEEARAKIKQVYERAEAELEKLLLAIVEGELENGKPDDTAEMDVADIATQLFEEYFGAQTTGSVCVINPNVGAQLTWWLAVAAKRLADQRVEKIRGQAQ